MSLKSKNVLLNPLKHEFVHSKDFNEMSMYGGFQGHLLKFRYQIFKT